MSSLKQKLMLSGNQLFEQSKKLDEYEVLTKLNKLEELDDDREAVIDEEGRKKSFQNLHDLLHLERVCMSNKRSKGTYLRSQHRVKINSIAGNLNRFGYMENDVMYLRSYEALLLIEMNRLEVDYNGISMSVEQAYAIFLSPRSTLSIEQYLVYAYLVRVGYYVVIHDFQSDQRKFIAAQKKNRGMNKDKMIWCILNERLNLPFSREFIESEQELYEETKLEMNKHYKAISGQNYDDDDTSNDDANEPPFKKFKCESDEQDKNFLDILKTELDYLSHEQIFKKFSYIRREDNAESSSSDCSRLKFNFDVSLPKKGFKRTEELANYRILILKTTDKFPSNAQLADLKRRQSYDVPIVLASVTESLSIHFCICTF